MTEEKATTFTGDKLEGFGVNADGSMVQITLSAPAEGGDKVFLTMPSANVPELFFHLGALLDSLIMAKALPPGVGKPLRSVTSWKVGQSNVPNLSKFAAIIFDEGLSQEHMVLLADIDALKLADAIEQKVFKGMSLDDQKAMIKEVEGARGGKPRLILPMSPGRH